jgi:hypothetical protein
MGGACRSEAAATLFFGVLCKSVGFCFVCLVRYVSKWMDEWMDGGMLKPSVPTKDTSALNCHPPPPPPHTHTNPTNNHNHHQTTNQRTPSAPPSPPETATRAPRSPPPTAGGRGRTAAGSSGGGRAAPACGAAGGGSGRGPVWCVGVLCWGEGVGFGLVWFVFGVEG